MLRRIVSLLAGKQLLKFISRNTFIDEISFITTYLRSRNFSFNEREKNSRNEKIRRPWPFFNSLGVCFRFIKFGKLFSNTLKVVSLAFIAMPMRFTYIISYHQISLKLTFSLFKTYFIRVNRQELKKTLSRYWINIVEQLKAFGIWSLNRKKEISY